ncbi:cochlin isoform X3 [Takifugu flavidus]|uniref:cochlin isoform X3 n=1 Tax=Takifugu flavidus TaxID=433684 RepID=UPI0025443BEA|nr:cochlin isoform X3 [Takifugu flavidus]
MSLLSVLQPLTGLFFLVSSSLSSASSVLLPVDCVTRGADLAQDRSLVLCPPACTQGRVSVFGTRTFASVSSVCGAAIHRGVLGPSGGPVRVHKLPGRHNYLSSLSHGVQSQALSHWSSSFSVTKPVSAPLELTSATSATALPAAQPAKKPTKKKLTVKKALTTGNKDCKIDIAMVIDSSNNIGQRRFNLQKNFLIKLAAMLKVGQTGPHIGVIQASDTPRTEFLLTNYTQPKELLFAIKELAYLGGDSNTGRAITHTTETFFNQESGGRRGYPRVMVVLIDGWPSDSLEQAAMLAREFGINVFLVSVAKPAPEELPMVPDKDFMKKAVCRDNGFFSYGIPSWFSTAKHVKALSQRLCSVDSLVCSKSCFNSVNIGFLIDGSSSVGHGNFQLVLEFLAGVAGTFDISDVGARIGAVQYTYDQRLEFGLLDHPTKDDALAALRRISYMSGGTATGEAISYCAQNLFRRTAPGRNFLIVVTDGQSYDDVRRPAMEAQAQGITIFSVGVAWAPLDDLRAMSSEPKDSHTFFTRDFSGLSEFVPVLVRGICRDFSEKN